MQHHQYSIVRYQDSLTALHDYRPPTREALSYTARRELQTAGAAVSQNGSNVRFTPIPDEEFDDGDIEVTPELLKEPSLYPALSLIQPIKETIRVTSSFGPRKHPVKRRRLMHAGVDIAGNRGEKVVALRSAKSCTAAGRFWPDHDDDVSGVTLRKAHLTNSSPARLEGQHKISAIPGPGGLRPSPALRSAAPRWPINRRSSHAPASMGIKHRTKENGGTLIRLPGGSHEGLPFFLYQSMVETLRASS
ncbi:MAG: M23 family metallopeptidase [Bilophila wadsworthia]